MSGHPTDGIHRGKTFKSRHPISNPQDAKPKIPLKRHHHTTSFKEDAPPHSFAAKYHEAKISSSTHAPSQTKETAQSSSWRTNREASQERKTEPRKQSSVREVNSSSSQSDEDSSPIPSKREDPISSSDQEDRGRKHFKHHRKNKDRPRRRSPQPPIYRSSMEIRRNGGPLSSNLRRWPQCNSGISAHGWSDSGKAVSFVERLRKDKRRDYGQLLKSLEKRYGLLEPPQYYSYPNTICRPGG